MIAAEDVAASDDAFHVVNWTDAIRVSTTGDILASSPLPPLADDGQDAMRIVSGPWGLASLAVGGNDWMDPMPVFAAVFAPGSTTGVPVELEDLPVWSFHRGIAADETGFGVVWTDIWGDESEVFVSRFRADGALRAPVQAWVGAAFSWSREAPSVAIDANDDLVFSVFSAEDPDHAVLVREGLGQAPVVEDIGSAYGLPEIVAAGPSIVSVWSNDTQLWAGWVGEPPEAIAPALASTTLENTTRPHLVRDEESGNFLVTWIGAPDAAEEIQLRAMFLDAELRPLGAPLILSSVPIDIGGVAAAAGAFAVATPAVLYLIACR